MYLLNFIYLMNSVNEVGMRKITEGIVAKNKEICEENLDQLVVLTISAKYFFFLLAAQVNT